MDDPSARPTTEIRDVILHSMDGMFGQLIGRLEGLTDGEYLWEPTTDAWSVRSGANDEVVVDGAGVREIDPAPVTTIAWRLWHIAIDCFDDYTRRFSGDQSDALPHWTLDAAEATNILAGTWEAYRSLVIGLDWWSELGDSWGPWGQHCVADMVIHASNELVHHGAEIGLLRDLYRASNASR